jgi:uncharacterized OB-fold protein
MSLATCPFCGTIFATKDRGCPTCTYRLPEEQLPHEGMYIGATIVEKTQRLIHDVVEKVHHVLPHHHHHDPD